MTLNAGTKKEKLPSPEKLKQTSKQTKKPSHHRKNEPIHTHKTDKLTKYDSLDSNHYID